MNMEYFPILSFLEEIIDNTSYTFYFLKLRFLSENLSQTLQVTIPE